MLIPNTSIDTGVQSFRFDPTVGKPATPHVCALPSVYFRPVFMNDS